MLIFSKHLLYFLFVNLLVFRNLSIFSIEIIEGDDIWRSLLLFAKKYAQGSLKFQIYRVIYITNSQNTGKICTFPKFSCPMKWFCSLLADTRWKTRLGYDTGLWIGWCGFTQLLSFSYCVVFFFYLAKKLSCQEWDGCIPSLVL